MKYYEFCQQFYISTTKGGLKHNTSEHSIAEFFIRLPETDDNMYDVLPKTLNAYDKWYSGKTKPRNSVWSLFKNLLVNSDTYTKCLNKLKSEFDKDYIGIVANRLGIAGKTVDINRFSSAVLNQLIDFSDNKGDCDNNCPHYYQGNVVNNDFQEYFNWARERYGVLKLLGGAEVPLKDFYVCNILGKHRYKYGDNIKRTGVYIEDATLSKIRDLYKDKGIATLKAKIIGCGGGGKSLMLQHIMLEALDKYPDSKVLPIYIELRNYIPPMELETYIYKTIHLIDESLGDTTYNQLLINGKCAIIMDGLDEIDPDHITGFHQKLNEFTRKYKKVQVIIASRACDSLKGLNGYEELHVWPFDDIQKNELIDKVVGDDKVKKQKILDYVTNGFLTKRGVFSSHPMLLTFVITNYDNLPDYKEKHLLFYQLAYEALLTGHDDNKKPYDRIFHSVNSPDEFTDVFMEFCGITYADGVYKFDKSSFNKYYKRLKSRKNLSNPSGMTQTKFLHDCCSTSCILYEETPGIYYIDPGFQEFLFAEYYADIDTASGEVSELLDALWDKSLIDYDNKLDAFEMLYNYAPEKINTLLVLPYLKSIFSAKTEDEQFVRFLVNTFDSITYKCLLKDMIPDASGKTLSYALSVNEPNSVIMALILKVNSLWSSFMYETSYELKDMENVKTKMLLAEHNPDESLIEIKSYRSQDHLYKDLYESGKLNPNGNTMIHYGYEYTIDTKEFTYNVHSYDGLLKTMIEDKSEFYKKFLAIKKLFNALSGNQKRNRFR